MAPPIPPVLLAGDHPDPRLWPQHAALAPKPCVEAVSTTATSPTPSELAGDSLSLPTTRVPTEDASPRALPDPVPLWIRPRDPYCLVIFWQADTEVLKSFAAQHPGGTWQLRLLGGETCHQVLGEEVLPLDTDHRFVPVPGAGCRYVAEIGFRHADHSWQLLTRAAPVTTPVAGPTATWTPPPPPTPVAGLPAGSKGSSTARRHARPPRPPPPLPSREPVRDLPESPELLWTLVWEPARSLPSLSSSDVAQWLTRLLPAPGPDFGAGPAGSSALTLQAPAPPSSTEWSHGPSRSFWLEVNAEVILYGRTEREARVTIGGRSIPLRSDGSFRFQFTLPDGAYDLPVVAVSPAGDDTRSARLEFSRTTTLAGEVGKHPQDPALSPPGVESLR